MSGIRWLMLLGQAAGIVEIGVAIYFVQRTRREIAALIERRISVPESARRRCLAARSHIDHAVGGQPLHPQTMIATRAAVGYLADAVQELLTAIREG